MALLPPGWVITESIEQVPNPNNSNGGLAFPLTYFARRTFICTDENGQYVAASGDQGDCQNQAQARAEARTQQRPYNEAI